MCPAYGLPDRLLDPIAHAVQEIAVHVLVQPPLSLLVWDWAERVSRGEHADLLKPEHAASLLLVMMETAQHVYSNPSDFPSDVEFALYADEIISVLQDIARPLLASV
jgi:hypothetical protein